MPINWVLQLLINELLVRSCLLPGAEWKRFKWTTQSNDEMIFHKPARLVLLCHMKSVVHAFSNISGQR